MLRIARAHSTRQEQLFAKYKDRHFGTFIAGTGGAGAMHFARDKQIAYGGPDGGNGGAGANVFLVADEKVENLYRLKDLYRAEHGEFGKSGRQDGRNGASLNVNVPVGTVVRSQEGKIVADLNESGVSFMVAQGGAGGLGNAFFCSNENRTPMETTPGNIGEATAIELEMRTLSNVGLVGLPNAGKSSLLNILSRAQSDVSDQPGTTLVPHIGTLFYNDHFSLSVADLPGIEPENVPYYFNTSRRAGQFLQHCSRYSLFCHFSSIHSDRFRCQSLVYVIDGDPEIPFTLSEQYTTIRQHLADYDESIIDELRELELAKSIYRDRFAHVGIELSTVLNESLTTLPFVVIVSKSDLQKHDREQIDDLTRTMQSIYASQASSLYYPKPLITSAQNHDGWSTLIYVMRHLYESVSGHSTDDLYW